MSTVRHFCLSCCLLCATAGMVRIFWPENNFKPVINTVLLLYIVASVVPLASQTDWGDLGRQLRSWAHSDLSATAPAMQQYAQALGQRSAAAALQAQLAAQGIAASVTVTEAQCTVTLSGPADMAAAEEIVRAACGTLPYRLLTWQESGQGGDVP